MARTLHGAHGVRGGMLRGVCDAVPRLVDHEDSPPARAAAIAGVAALALVSLGVAVAATAWARRRLDSYDV